MKHVIFHADHTDHDPDHLDHIPAVVACRAGSVPAQIQRMKHVLHHADHTDPDHLDPISAS